jgi:hypothetical protein
MHARYWLWVHPTRQSSNVPNSYQQNVAFWTWCWPEILYNTSILISILLREAGPEYSSSLTITRGYWYPSRTLLPMICWYNTDMYHDKEIVAVTVMMLHVIGYRCVRNRPKARRCLTLRSVQTTTTFVLVAIMLYLLSNNWMVKSSLSIFTFLFGYLDYW